MIVLCCNVAHPDMRKKLLLEKDLTFERAVEICLEEEKALRTSKQLAKGGSDVCETTANATSAYSQNRSQHQQHGRGQERGRSASRNWRAQGTDRSQSQARGGNTQEMKCFSCGRLGHKSKAPECKATDKTCRNCEKKGHFETVCKAPKRHSSGPQTNNLGVGSLSVTNTEFEPLENIEVTLSTQDGDSIQADALPDTGANVSCISPSTLKLLGLSTNDLEKEERTLGLLQHQLMTAITELQVVQGWIAASCCSMSSDKECRVLDGEEEDKSEGKVLKEGSEAHQPANQQADCREQIMCRCEGWWRGRGPHTRGGPPQAGGKTSLF